MEISSTTTTATISTNEMEINIKLSKENIQSNEFRLYTNTTIYYRLYDENFILCHHNYHSSVRYWKFITYFINLLYLMWNILSFFDYKKINFIDRNFIHLINIIINNNNKEISNYACSTTIIIIIIIIIITTTKIATKLTTKIATAKITSKIPPPVTIIKFENLKIRTNNDNKSNNNFIIKKYEIKSRNFNSTKIYQQNDHQKEINLKKFSRIHLNHLIINYNNDDYPVCIDNNFIFIISNIKIHDKIIILENNLITIKFLRNNYKKFNFIQNNMKILSSVKIFNSLILFPLQLSLNILFCRKFPLFIVNFIIFKQNEKFKNKIIKAKIQIKKYLFIGKYFWINENLKIHKIKIFNGNTLRNSIKYIIKQHYVDDDDNKKEEKNHKEKIKSKFALFIMLIQKFFAIINKYYVNNNFKEFKKGIEIILNKLKSIFILFSYVKMITMMMMLIKRKCSKLIVKNYVMMKYNTIFMLKVKSYLNENLFLPINAPSSSFTKIAAATTTSNKNITNITSDYDVKKTESFNIIIADDENENDNKDNYNDDDEDDDDNNDKNVKMMKKKNFLNFSKQINNDISTSVNDMLSSYECDNNQNNSLLLLDSKCSINYLKRNKKRRCKINIHDNNEREYVDYYYYNINSIKNSDNICKNNNNDNNNNNVICCNNNSRNKTKKEQGRRRSGGSSGIRNGNNLLYVIRIFFIILIISNLSESFHHNIKYSVNIIKTKYGPLRGIIIRNHPKIVEAFLGVPYASPPVGSLRFMPPVIPSRWQTTRLADHYSAVCPQALPSLSDGPEALLEVPRGRLAQIRRLLPLLANQSEDCLYLNIYVPRTSYPNSSPSSSSPLNDFHSNVNIANHNENTSNIDKNKNAYNFNGEHFMAEDNTHENKLLPTILYIHGESFEWNSGNLYDGSVLAGHGNIIVVTINFRLGVLGFLKTGGKGSAQGNYGLMDLVAGLHWLRQNLPAFGGDPNKITLMGHGTGAALSNILVVSPVAKDLVHRAILLSGSALSPWALQKDPLFVKRRVAEQTGCHGNLLLDDLAPCLRTKPVAELLAVKIDSPRFLPGFAPFIDGTVIIHPSSANSNRPITLPIGSAIASTSGIELADFPSRELIFGLTSIESYLDFNAQDLEFGFNETRRDRILRTYVRNVYHYHLNEIYAALKNEYTDWERVVRNPMGSRDASLEFLSDGHTAAPLIRLGYLHSLRGGRSYFLHFKHQSGEWNFPQRSGSIRGEDVPFYLGLPISPLFQYNYTRQDIKISVLLLRYLSNFASTGNPNDALHNKPQDLTHIVHRNSELNNTSLTLASASLTLSSAAHLLPSSSSAKSVQSSVKDLPLLASTAVTSTGRVKSNNFHQHVTSSARSFSSSSSSPFPNALALKLLPHSSSSPLQTTISRMMSSTSQTSILPRDKDVHMLTLRALLRDRDVSTRMILNLKRHVKGTTLRRRKRKTKVEDKKRFNNYRKSNKFIQRQRYTLTKMLNTSPDESDKNEFLADQKVINTRTKTRRQYYPERKNHQYYGEEAGIEENEEEEEEENGSENENEQTDSDDSDEEFRQVENYDTYSSSGIEKQPTSEDNSENDESAQIIDRLKDVKITKLPFWDTYDAVNQLYLELGNKIEIHNHYRGHKLSMWLSLIPQLHSPSDLNELPMRHHHFAEENAQFYDGIIRPQITQRPSLPKTTPQQHQSSQRPSTYQMTSTTKMDHHFKNLNIKISGTTTECPPNATIIPTIAATRPQNHQQNGNGLNSVISHSIGSRTEGGISRPDSHNLLRRLTSPQYQSYTAALMVTVAVGCFLLLLNVIIFAGIYYQREKRANDAKKKEELQEVENACTTRSPCLEKIGRNIADKGSRKSSIQSLGTFEENGSFSEYTCYEEKLQCKEKHSLQNICNVELSLKEFKRSSSPTQSNSGSLERSKKRTTNYTAIPSICPPSYHHHTPSKSIRQDQQQQTCSKVNKMTLASTHFQHQHQHYQTQLHQHHQYHQHQQKQQQKSLQTYSTAVNTAPTELCNQSTQSEQPSSHDVGTSVDEKNVGGVVNFSSIYKKSSSSISSNLNKSNNNEKPDKINTSTNRDKNDNNDETANSIMPDPPPPPKSSVSYQGGILRQPGPGPTGTPGTSKKRVQIQEISV